MGIQNRARTRLPDTQNFVSYQIIFSEDPQATIFCVEIKRKKDIKIALYQQYSKSKYVN